MTLTANALLDVRQASRHFGGIRALTDVSMRLRTGELVGLIGPNGAGKTTLFNLLTGVYEPSEGTIILNGESVGGMKPYQINHKGAARTFQNIRLFGNMTVADNVKIAYNRHAKYSVWSSLFRLPSFRAGEKEIADKALAMLKIFKLDEQRNELAKNLSYGGQRRLEIARALAAQPKLLLLDEPAAGMNPQETRELMNLIRWVREEFQLSILLIEHDMSLVMGVCDRIYVLDQGKLIAEGTPDEVRSNPRVIQAYLGQEA
ncbi:ABC transporter ATP-binding protein [Gorillibacterium massiliense]|uniref:ABC transporter ATP-binding protein n=1 Tax=Gorillibacterium massiliense TaxID=1280390 RepID=UPI0004B07AEE|nr:ABC transporter ATP-binding protein [Gorillibacterium massiliense]